MIDILTYCENCLENFDDEGFDYRFEFPICHQCVNALRLEPTEGDN